MKCEKCGTKCVSRGDMDFLECKECGQWYRREEEGEA